jgi:hypothetical protein
MSKPFRIFFYATAYPALYTGFLLIAFLGKPADLYPVLRQVLLKIHILTVVLWVFSCGMLFNMHVIPQLQAGIRAGRRTGILLVVVLILMVASGFIIQIFPSQAGLYLIRWSHTLAGIAFSLLFVFHLALIRAGFRKWIIATLAVSALVSLPLMLLKAPEPVLPDEINLTPQDQTSGQKKSP